MLDDGNEVICLDNFDSYYDPKIKQENLASFVMDKNFSLIVGDIRDEELLQNIMTEVDYVFHEAAQAGVRISVDDPMKPHDVNATGTLKILKAALDTDVKKIIYASSSSVYGKVKYLPFDENHPNNPISPYGVSKLMAEHYCEVFRDIYGLKTVSLRYFTVYGPKMRPDLAISIFVKNALNNTPISIFGDGNKTRDFTYIDDIVKANLISMRTGTGIYNIGCGNRISIKDLAEKIIDITKSTSEIVYTESAKGDADHTLANIDKARNDLNWKPETTIDEGLRRYVLWLSNYQQ